MQLKGLEGAVVFNAYYLQDEATSALRRGESASAVVEEVFAKAAALGVRAVRTNGFNDLGANAIQVAPGQYDPTALRGLALVLDRAQAHGIKLILPLGNHWDAYGGARQYVAWTGLRNPLEGDPRFYADPRVITLYEQHLERLLPTFARHPAVLALELVNEPRARSLRSWIDRVGALVRARAPGLQLATGEEGTDLGAFLANSASPQVTYASAHLYPEDYGIPLEDVPGWLSRRAAAARLFGKPLVVGEFGLRTAGLPLAERRAHYGAWLTCARASGIAAMAPWLFVDDARPRAWDPFSFGYRTGTAPADPENAIATLFALPAAPPSR